MDALDLPALQCSPSSRKLAFLALWAICDGQFLHVPWHSLEVLNPVCMQSHRNLRGSLIQDDLRQMLERFDREAHCQDTPEIACHAHQICQHPSCCGAPCTL